MCLDSIWNLITIVFGKPNRMLLFLLLIYYSLLPKLALPDVQKHRWLHYNYQLATIMLERQSKPKLVDNVDQKNIGLGHHDGFLYFLTGCGYLRGLIHQQIRFCSRSWLELLSTNCRVIFSTATLARTKDMRPAETVAKSNKRNTFIVSMLVRLSKNSNNVYLQCLPPNCLRKLPGKFFSQTTAFRIS